MSPSLCRQQEGDKNRGWAWRGTEFCLRPSLGLLTLNKAQRQSDIITPHFTCSRSFRPPWPRPWLRRGSRRQQVTLLRRGCPDWVLPPGPWPGSGGGSLLATPSGPGPQTPPSRHPGKIKGPGIQPALRLLRQRRAPTAAWLITRSWALLRLRESCARERGTAHAQTPGARPAMCVLGTASRHL